MGGTVMEDCFLLPPSSLSSSWSNLSKRREAREVRLLIKPGTRYQVCSHVCSLPGCQAWAPKIKEDDTSDRLLKVKVGQIVKSLSIPNWSIRSKPKGVAAYVGSYAVGALELRREASH